MVTDPALGFSSPTSILAMVDFTRSAFSDQGEGAAAGYGEADVFHRGQYLPTLALYNPVQQGLGNIKAAGQPLDLYEGTAHDCSPATRIQATEPISSCTRGGTF